MILKLVAILVIVSLIVTMMILYAEIAENKTRGTSNIFSAIFVVSSLVLAIMCLMT